MHEQKLTEINKLKEERMHGMAETQEQACNNNVFTLINWGRVAETSKKSDRQAR